MERLEHNRTRRLI